VGKWVGAMRCIGCGEEMRLLQAVADQTMMVPGYEHQTLECPGCHGVERRLVFARPIGPLTLEPMRLSSSPPAPTAAPKQSEGIDVSRTWARAVERLRSQQSALKERAEGARISETVRQFYQTWDGLTPRRRGAPPAKPAKPARPARPAKSTDEPVQSSRPKLASGKDRAQNGAAPVSALARVVAKLRSHQASISARMVHKELEGQPFDQLWETLGASPRQPTPPGKAPTPRPRPLAKSRSLVPIEARPEQASSAWARAVAMLQGRQDRGL
jgi:hypothetical protein